MELNSPNQSLRRRVAVVVAASMQVNSRKLAEGGNLEGDSSYCCRKAYLTMNFRGQQIVNIFREFPRHNGAGERS